MMAGGKLAETYRIISGMVADIRIEHIIRRFKDLNIQITDCPQKLQESIKDWQERVPYSKVIAIRKVESTPYKDKTIVRITYKAYLQFAYEFLILSIATENRTEYRMEESVNSNILNGGDITTIVKNADYIKEDLKRDIFGSQENFPDQ